MMSSIATPRSLVVLSILLKVDEEGAEAAAATAILIGDCRGGSEPPPVPVIFNHPSIVAITDKLGVPLFLGHVSNPEQKWTRMLRNVYFLPSWERCLEETLVTLHLDVFHSFFQDKIRTRIYSLLGTNVVNRALNLIQSCDGLVDKSAYKKVFTLWE